MSEYTQPSATTLLVDDLVAAVHDGRVRVPEFQRPLRWQWEDVRRLFDSILLGYPIGSLLLWQRPAPAATIWLGAIEVAARAMTDALWVVDGQQRITSLANALSDDGSRDTRFSLSYNLEKGELQKRPQRDDSLSLPLPILFDLQRLLKWFAEHREAAEYLDEATRVAKAIRQYTVPAYIVKQDKEGVLRDIFDRMNNYGRRLSRAEVFSAIHSNAQSSSSPRNFGELAERVNARIRFGVLDEGTVLHALLARRGPNMTREIRVEFKVPAREFPDETPEAAYHGAEEALVRALEFLQQDACIPHFGFLPYRYLLVVLARFFAHHPNPEQRNRELLRRWFWRASVLGPTIARDLYTNAMRKLALCIEPSDENRSVQNLLEAVSRQDTLQAFTFPSQFSSTKAEVRFVLCAMWDLSPRSPRTGEPYDRALLSDVLDDRDTATNALQRCFPRAPTARGKTANRIFLLNDDEIMDERPESISPLEWDDILMSHAFDEHLANLLQNGDHERFIIERSSRLDQIARAFLVRMTESRFEDTPPLDSLDMDEDEGNEVERH